MTPIPTNPHAVDEAIETRRSIRGFLPDPIPRAEVERLQSLASRATSGSNIQPWTVHFLSGAALRRLTDDLMAAHRAGEPEAREYE